MLNEISNGTRWQPIVSVCSTWNPKLSEMFFGMTNIRVCEISSSRSWSNGVLGCLFQACWKNHRMRRMELGVYTFIDAYRTCTNTLALTPFIDWIYHNITHDALPKIIVALWIRSYIGHWWFSMVMVALVAWNFPARPERSQPQGLLLLGATLVMGSPHSVGYPTIQDWVWLLSTC